MKNLLLVLLFVFAAIGIYGCSSKNYFSSVEEKKQFIEIITSSDEMIGIINDNKEIEKFVKQLDIASWEYMNRLDENNELAYSYISYEVIDDPLFLQNKTPMVNKSILELYISNRGQYIIRNYGQGGETIARVSEEAGRFLNAPEELNLNKKMIAKDILDEWGFDFYVKDDNTEKIDDIENVRYYQGDTSFTEKELTNTSKEQKIQICGADKNHLLNEIDAIPEIVKYLNGLTLDKWEYVNSVPDPKEVECQVVRLMLPRKSNEKELKEVYTQILYKSNEIYYIEEIIPNDHSYQGEFKTYYKVPKETAKYILSYLE